MIEVPVVDMQGKRVGSEKLDPAWLGGRVRVALLKQAIVAYRTSQRQGTRKQKTRAEVHGAGRKLYRQKGTGRARAGNLRTPTRRGGGRAFALVPTDFSQPLPRQMRRLARDSALLAKAQAGDLLILDQLKLPEPKTKLFAGVLKSIEAPSCLLAIPGEDAMLWRAGRNVADVTLKPVAQINAYDVMRRPKVVLVRDAYHSLIASARRGGGPEN